MLYSLLKNPATTAVIPFIAGVVTFSVFQPSTNILISLLIALLAASILLFLSSHSQFSIILIMTSFFLLGCLVSAAHESALPENHVRNLAKKYPDLFMNNEMEISGVITGTIESSARGMNVVVRLTGLKSSQYENNVTGTIKLFIPNDSAGENMNIVSGDCITTFARIRIPRRYGNPKSFDYQSYLASQGIYLLGSVKSVHLVTIERKGSYNPFRIVSCLRQQLIRNFRVLRAHEVDDQDAMSLVIAMTLGSREDVGSKTSKILRMSGIYHIVAISGMNFGIIALITFKFLHLLKLPEKLMCMITSFVLIAYLIMSGGRSSAIRAVIMAISYLIARSIQRKVDILNCISSSAYAMLLFNPLLIYDPGFQLTYAATAALVTCYPLMKKLTGRANPLLSIVTATASAQIGVIPIIAYHFNTITYFSFFANIIAVPSLFVIVPLGLLGEILSLFSMSLAKIACVPLVLLVKTIIQISSLYVCFPYLAYRIPTPSIVTVIVYYLSGVSLLLLMPASAFKSAGFFTLPGSSKSSRFSKYRKLYNVCIATLFAITFIIISCYPFQPQLSGFFEVTFLDVGQGESVFIVLPDGYSILIDAGPRTESSFDLGEMVVSKYLFLRGFKKIDAVIATHLHADHAGGIPSVIENFTVSQVIISEKEKDEMLYQEIADTCASKNTALNLVKGNMKIQKGRMTAEIGNPQAQENGSASQNEKSLLIMMSYGSVRFLFTGDATTAVENALIESKKDLECEILQIGHHGSSDSTSELFLKKIQPKVCIISVGAYNQWGHPSKRVIERIEKAGSALLRTDRDGAISIYSDGRSFSVTSYIIPERSNSSR